MYLLTLIIITERSTPLLKNRISRTKPEEPTNNACSSAPCGRNGICLLKDNYNFTCRVLNDESSFAQSFGPFHTFLITIPSLILVILNV